MTFVMAAAISASGRCYRHCTCGRLGKATRIRPCSGGLGLRVAAVTRELVACRVFPVVKRSTHLLSHNMEMQLGKSCRSCLTINSQMARLAATFLLCSANCWHSLLCSLPAYKRPHTWRSVQLASSFPNNSNMSRQVESLLWVCLHGDTSINHAASAEQMKCAAKRCVAVPCILQTT